MEITNDGFCKRYLERDIEKELAEHLGLKYRKYRNAWRDAGVEHIPDFPIHLDLELVDACNQNCKFCARNKRTHSDLPYEINTGTKISGEMIDSIVKEAGEQQLYSINFAFGEPLIYKNVFKIVRKFHEAGVIDSRLVTNGVLLSDYIDEIFDSGLINLYVSIDAFTAETYKKQRGYGFKRVVKGFSDFISEKRKRKSLLPITRVSFVETGDNKQELDDFKAFWKEKVDFIDIQFYQDFNKTSSKTKRKMWQCIDPFRRLAITANGQILPCCTFYGKCLPIGNINEITIKEAWESNRLRTIRDNLLNDKEPICLGCQEC